MPKARGLSPGPRCKGGLFPQLCIWEWAQQAVVVICIRLIQMQPVGKVNKQALRSLSTTSNSGSILVVGKATAETTWEVSGKENSHFLPPVELPLGESLAEGCQIFQFFQRRSQEIETLHLPPPNTIKPNKTISSEHETH